MKVLDDWALCLEMLTHLALDINFALLHICSQEECLLSDPQGESDADADIEDTDCRFARLRHPCLSLASPPPDQLLTSFQTPGAGLAPADQLAQTQAAAHFKAGHHGERGRRWAEPQIPSLEPQAES